MKKIYVAILVSFTSLLASATVHTVTVGPSSFNPPTVTAVCGDTVAWVLASGSHTTTSTSVPVCATAWNANINSTTPAFAIVVPCAGTYNYHCTPHLFTGVINVTCTTGIEGVSANEDAPSVYPNPSANGIFNVTFGDVRAIHESPQQLPKRVYIVDTKGKRIMDVSVGAIHESPVHESPVHVINLQSCASGVYFLITEGEKGRRVTKLVR